MGKTYLLRVWGLLAAGALAGSGAVVVAGPLGGGEGDPIALTCELGITLALSGEIGAAESTFVSLLSRSPGDPRALNNLGNLHLWRGEPDVALGFYRDASAADTADAGIVLNEATALLLLGDQETAGERAGEGVRKAGGTAQAADLLGLRIAPEEGNARAADRTRISREEVLALLHAAVSAVPSDSTPAAPDSAAPGTEGRPPRWRSAGARGASASDLDAVVYWKH